jgi:hypothetical protein
LPHRRGISLLEVLASIGVMSIGLLALAALLPIGRYTLGEAAKADRAGDCGRAGMRDVIVRRMLDPNNWVSPTGDPRPKSFLIDPRGFLESSSGSVALGGIVPRVSLSYSNTASLADQVFTWPDDLKVDFPEEMKPPLPVGRPVNADPSGNPLPLANWGDYSWFASVVPSPGNPTRFVVSIVVCCKRDFSETTATVSTFGDSGVAGGSIVLSGLSGPFDVKENDWIALCGTSTALQNKPIPTLCRWYRVASVGDDGVSLTLIGPDWDTSYTTTAVALGQSVIGVYTTTIDLDTDPTWKN